MSSCVLFLDLQTLPHQLSVHKKRFTHSKSRHPSAPASSLPMAIRASASAGQTSVKKAATARRIGLPCLNMNPIEQHPKHELTLVSYQHSIVKVCKALAIIPPINQAEPPTTDQYRISACSIVV